MINCFRTLSKVGTLLFCLCCVTASSMEITVAVATNFLSTLKELQNKFEADHDAKITLVSGASGQLFAQIKNGAPYDVFLSADQAKIDAIVEEELGIDDSRITYALGRLCFMLNPKRKHERHAEELFESLNFNRIVLANSKLAPYGVAAEEVFDALDVDLDDEEKKIVLADNVGKSYAILRSGNADVGMVALSSILDDELDQKLYYIIPKKLYSPIRQDAIVLKRTKDVSGARAFLKFIQISDAQSIIRTNGYVFD